MPISYYLLFIAFTFPIFNYLNFSAGSFVRLPVELTICIDLLIFFFTILLINKNLKQKDFSNKKFIYGEAFNFDILLFFLLLFFVSLFCLYKINASEYFHYIIRNFFIYSFIGFNVFIELSTVSLLRNIFFIKFIINTQILIGLIFIVLYFLLNIDSQYLLWDSNRFVGTLISPENLGSLLLAGLVSHCIIDKQFQLKLSFLPLYLAIISTQSLNIVIGFLIISLNSVKEFLKLLLLLAFALFLNYTSIINFQVLHKINSLFNNSWQNFNTYTLRLDTYSFMEKTFYAPPLDFLIGLSSDKYYRFDSSYLNFYFNMGFIFLVLFLIFGAYIIINTKNKFIRTYFIWFFLIGNNLAPLLNRWNTILIFFLMLALDKSFFFHTRNN